MSTNKTALFVVAGILLTLGAFALDWNGDANNPQSTGSADNSVSRLFSKASGGSLESRMNKLENSLKNSMQIQSELFDLVEELRDQMEGGADDSEMGTRNASAVLASDDQKNHSRRNRFRRYRNTQVQNLIEAGLTRERAEFILDQQDRFQYEQMKRSYEFRHIDDKSSANARAIQEDLKTRFNNPRSFLEQELSADEFEKYLEANGARRKMRINNVMKNTPAFEAGLRPGDTIVSYNGEKVFHMGELQSQIYKVEPGKTVAIEVKREGSSSAETVYVNSGPLGIRG